MNKIVLIGVHITTTKKRTLKLSTSSFAGSFSFKNHISDETASEAYPHVEVKYACLEVDGP